MAVADSSLLQITTGLELCGIVEGQDGVAERGSQVAAALAALNDDFGDVAERLYHVLRLLH